jgi:2,4-dienoyl-CoA reductase-like NADH-dependent reductase (Old Yellow Enzyme family)
MSSPPDVFSPAKLGPIALRNRIIKAATFEARTPDALVTDDLIEDHRLPAAGGVGMTTVAYCAVSPGGRTEGNGLWMRPEAVPGLRRLTDAIHAEGAAASAQIGHAGPVANAKSNKATALAPVRFFNPIGMRFAKKATRDDIDDVIAGHAAAAACHRGRLRRRRNPFGPQLFGERLPVSPDQSPQRRVRRIA